MTQVMGRWGVWIPLLALGACGGVRRTDLAPSPSEKTIQSIPEWYLAPPQEKDHLHAVGSETSADMQLAFDKAKTTAQADLAQQIETRMEGLTKRFQEEVGLGDDSELLSQFTTATRAVTSQSLTGAEVVRREVRPEGGIYRGYVLMRLPIGAANSRLLEMIRGNQKLHTRLRSAEAFEELDKAVRSD